MAARSLGLAAAFGLAANAFLLPPTLSTTDTKESSDLETWMIVDPLSQPLLVPCAGCETETGAKSLFLDFSTRSVPGTLQLGGVQLFPIPTVKETTESSKPDVMSVPVEKSLFEVVSEPASYPAGSITAWNSYNDQPEISSESGEDLITITFQIKSVNDVEVTVPDIRIIVLKDSEMLNILEAHVQEEDEEMVPHKPEIVQEARPACQSALCQWRQFVEDKVHGIAAAAHHKFGHGRPFGYGRPFSHGRPCPGKMAGMMKGGMPHGPPFTTLHHGPDSHHHRPIGDFGRPHHPHGRPEFEQGPPHHPMHKFHHILHRVGHVIMSVLTPILIGFAAGVFAYAVGMVVGLAIGLIWIKVVRGGKRGYASVAQAEDEAEAKEAEVETESRTSLESAPPVYEDAPAYEEKQVV